MFTRDTGFLLRNWADLSSEVGKWCSVSMKALHLQQETGQEMGFIFGCSKYFECGASMVDYTRSVSFRISLLSPIYITSNNSVNKAKLSGNFPHWCSTIVSLDTYIYYAFQNWLCKHLWSVLNFCWLFYTYSQAFNHLHPKTSMHNLHIVLYTFPKVLTGRICLPIKRFLPWWPFYAFSLPECVIQDSYCWEKLDASHSSV